MHYSDEEIIRKYLDTIPLNPSSTKQVFLLGMIGNVGSGKSYLANLLSKRLNLFVASNDQIRRFLEEVNYESDGPKQPVVQKIAEARTHYLFGKHISHIQDADMIQFANLATENANKYGGKVYFIEVVCPEDILVKRLEDREKEVRSNQGNNLSRSGVEDYKKRKLIRESFTKPEIFAIVDTSLNLDPQIEEIVGKLQKFGAI